MINYFTDDETTVTNTGLPNIPNAMQKANIENTRKQMNCIRVVIGKPINVNSWFRDEEVNSIIGGTKNSPHLFGYAVDFWCKGLTNDQICDMIDAAGIEYDQLIDEFNGYCYWVHISFDPRMRKERLIARKVNGKMQYRKVLSE